MNVPCKVLVFSALLIGFAALVVEGLNAQEARKPMNLPKESVKEPVEVKSKVVAVTIYSDSALVTREVDIPQGVGSMEVVVSSLPSKVQASSLYSEGNEGIRILATRFRNKPIKEDKREEVRKIEEEIKKNEIENQKIQAMITANTANTTFLNKLEGFASASTVNATEKGKLDSDTAIALANYLKTERITRAQENFELTQKSKEILAGNQFLQRKLQELSSGTVRTPMGKVVGNSHPEKSAGLVQQKVNRQ